jgi:predicted nucleic acid-binding Zn ribbon protein
MRRRNTESIGEVLRQFFDENAFIRTKLAESRVISGWGQLFGAVVSSYTSNIYLRNNVLHVHLNSSVLRSELMMSKEKIIANLNVHAGMDVVKDIIFR